MMAKSVGNVIYQCQTKNEGTCAMQRIYVVVGILLCLVLASVAMLPAGGTDPKGFETEGRNYIATIQLPDPVIGSVDLT